MAVTKHMKIFTAFSFLKVKSPDLLFYKWVYPTIIFMLYPIYRIIGENFYLINVSNMIGDLNTFMGILVGFYIAALAAVSSFTNENLDQIMKGNTPILETRRKGQIISEKLTRRRFLTILFGYCAVVSIFIYIFGVVHENVNILSGNINWFYEIIIEFSWILYFWFICSLLTTTLLGLHYLVERMHRA